MSNENEWFQQAFIKIYTTQICELTLKIRTKYIAQSNIDNIRLSIGR